MENEYQETPDLEVEIDQEAEREKEECRNISKRANYLLYVLFFGFICVIYAIISLQFFGSGHKLRSEAEGTNFKLVDVPARRGDILSANGNVISSSVKKYKIYMDLRPKQLSNNVFSKNYGALADSLSKLFKDTSPAGYRERLKKWRREGHGNKQISPPGVLLDYNDLQRLKKFPILDRHSLNGGAKEQYQYERMNYYGSLAQRTIGRVETPTAKGYGIELSFDKELKGRDGKSYHRKVSGSFWMPTESLDNVEPVDGCDILTTIDANIQDVAESSLRQKLDENKALWATAVVMEVETGEVRAMVNLGRNKKGEIIEDYNHSIADNVEPGSTYKLIPLIILLENTDMTIETMVDTKQGRDVINGITVNDSERGGYGVIPLKTAMSKSSNIGFAHAVDNHYRGKAKDFIQSIHDLGITKEMNFQLVGEKKPVVKSDTARSWSKSDLVTMSYGYATHFTAMRILMLYNAIANNGKLIKPIVVKEVRRNGRTVEEFETEVLKDKVCSNSTLKQVRIALEDVMFDGTVRQVFKGENYVVAGKTGTSRQVGPNGRYDTQEGLYYLASFVGYFPANNPKYTCIVQFKTLKPFGVARQFYGAALAAPVFKDISHYISTQADWGRSARDYAAEKEIELAKFRESEALKENRAPAKQGKSVYEDDRNMDYTKFPIKALGTEDDIHSLVRKFDLEDYTIHYIPKEEGEEDDYIEQSKMPSVIGLGLTDALSRLEVLGLGVTVNGKGRVVRQSIPANTKVIRGNKVTITLSL